MPPLGRHCPVGTADGVVGVRERRLARLPDALWVNPGAPPAPSGGYAGVNPVEPAPALRPRTQHQAGARQPH